MVYKVIYARDGAFQKSLAIMTIREHLCGFHESKVRCVRSDLRRDPQTRHMVCCGCSRIAVDSGLRRCDICDREYIDRNKYQDPNYECNCPECVIEFGIEE